MPADVVNQRLNFAIKILFEESFENVRGVYLDKGTSLFETLAGISAETASIPVGGKCATLAAQVEHIRFYLDSTEQVILNRDPGKLDWDYIWRTVSAVTPEAWQISIERLRESYQRIRALLEGIEDWGAEIDGTYGFGIVAHTAYHLGEIRQALCTLVP